MKTRLRAHWRRWASPLVQSKATTCGDILTITKPHATPVRLQSIISGALCLAFFSWLEDEDYIVKSPVRRIHRVKTAQITKETLSDEELETLRDACESKRDLAVVDLLASTGMRIGELIRLNVADVNLQERECIVTGKGNKQRPVYFDVRAKLHLAESLGNSC